MLGAGVYHSMALTGNQVKFSQGWSPSCLQTYRDIVYDSLLLFIIFVHGKAYTLAELSVCTSYVDYFVMRFQDTKCNMLIINKNIIYPSLPSCGMDTWLHRWFRKERWALSSVSSLES